MSTVREILNKILNGVVIREVLLESVSDIETPSQIVHANWPYHSNKMETIDINGVQVKTNLGASMFPMLKGYESGYSKVADSTTLDKTFDDLFEKGYRYIRFARLSTAVRGWNNFYVLAKK